MHGYRFRPEDRAAADKGSLYLPVNRAPMPRSLVTPGSRMPPSVTPGPKPLTVREKTPHDPLLDGLRGEVRNLVEAMRDLQQRMYNTREKPFTMWRVDQITLDNVTAVWLDQRNPASNSPQQQRFLQGRRGVIIVNHDSQNQIYIRHVEGALATSGGYVAAEGSITLPLGPTAKIWALSSAASSLISFYQFA
jgi:hypothetical protein